MLHSSRLSSSFRRTPATTNAMRKQYHLRPSPNGLLAWDVDRLIELTASLPAQDIALSTIRELDQPFWFGGESQRPRTGWWPTMRG